MIRNAYEFDIGGAERFVVLLAEQLEKNNLESFVVSRHAGILEFASKSGVRAYKGWWWKRQNWSGLRTLVFPLYLIWQIFLTGWYFRLFLRLKPDVIHAQSKDDFIAATVAGRMLGKHIVWTDHADLKYVFANHQTWYKNPVGKTVYLASKLAHAIAIVSLGEQQLIEKSLGKKLDERFHLIYNGVPDLPVKPTAKSEDLKGKVIFCATSRLVKAKGIGELLSAFKNIYATNKNVHLWLVGSGPEEKKFKKQAEDSTAIEFLSFRNDALEYVAACDIFVHPSYNEAFSLSLIEAAMLGRPIIACRVGGNPEIVHDNQNGLLIPPKDEVALENAMKELLNDAFIRDDYGSHGRKLYEENFRFEDIVKQCYLPLYEK